MLVFLLIDLVPENRTKILKPLSLFLNIIILEQDVKYRALWGGKKKAVLENHSILLKSKRLNNLGFEKKNHIER